MVNKNQAVIVTAAGFIVMAVVVAGLVLAFSVSITSHGHVESSANLGVYADEACTQRISEVDWGVLSPGGSSSVTFFIKNAGNAVLTLNLTASGWSPVAAQNYLTFSWTYVNGTRLAVGQVLPVDVSLHVSPSIMGITDFSVDLNVTGTN